MLLPVSKKHQKSLSQKPHVAEFVYTPLHSQVSVTHSSLVRRSLWGKGEPAMSARERWWYQASAYSVCKGFGVGIQWGGQAFLCSSRLV